MSVLLALMIMVPLGENKAQNTLDGAGDTATNTANITNTTLSITDNANDVCPYDFSFAGQNVGVSGFTQHFPVQHSTILQGSDIQWLITQKDTQDVFRVSTTGDLYYEFNDAAAYQIQGIIDHAGCEYADAQNISIYDNSYYYIGQYLNVFDSEINRRIDLSPNNLSTYILSEETSPSDITDKDLSLIHQSQTILYYSDNYSLLFTMLEQWIASDIDVGSKNIVIIVQENQDLVKKFLAPRIQKSGRDNIFLISKEEFDDILIELSREESETPSFTDPLLYTSSTWRISLEGFIDLLLYRGFSLSILSAVLAFAVLVLLIVSTRQLLGFSGYSYYYPLLSGLLLYITSREITTFLIVLGLVSHYLTKILFRYINLLFYGKLGVYTICYIILLLVSLGFIANFTTIQFDILITNENTLLLALIVAPMISKKLATESKYPTKRSRWRHMMRFGFLTWLCSTLLGHEPLRYRLLLNAEIIVVILFLTIIVGRFTGLQLAEYIRFAPLIRRGIKKKRKQLQKN